MWNDTFTRRDADTSVNRKVTGFVDKKGVHWSVNVRSLPERRGRVALDFASNNGKRRSSEINALQVAELENLTEQGWQAMLSNAAVIEME